LKAITAKPLNNPGTKPSAVIVQQGKVLDFIDGVTQRNETPEEYVRQEISKSLVREYGYSRSIAMTTPGFDCSAVLVGSQITLPRLSSG
jgi:hypothetical protein